MIFSLLSSAVLEVEFVAPRRQREPVLVAVLEEVVVGLEGEVELPDEVGQHQEDHGEAEVLADAAASASLKLQRSSFLI